MPPGYVMEPRSDPTNTVWPLPFTPQDWEQTPPAVQAYLRTVCNELVQLQERVETLEARLKQTSTTSSWPSSTDSPYKRPRRRTTSTTPRKAGGQPGHQGHRQELLAPSRVVEVRPEPCVCGTTGFAVTSPYYTHQVIELPPIAMEVTHWVLQQGWCQTCGRWSQAHVSAEHASGYAVIARQARQAPVNYIDETPWYCLNALEWLWVLASERVAFYMIHPRRSKEAFAALIDDWDGILVSDGYGVYQSWVEAWQTCVAHLIRIARGLAERQTPDIAACGAWALTELQRLCH